MQTYSTTTAILSSKLLPGLSALALGLTIILGVGFMQGAGNYLHNAAHDSRHNAAFPCH